ncbi:Calcineurin-binding protein cabin-1 [Lamellibrachia satsuma]|nr:Calcineurin-binding protein cabin-1 [Lamellibrachia satsuma]
MVRLTRKVKFDSTAPEPQSISFNKFQHAAFNETTKSNEAVESSNDLPPYILFLDVVHEYLGRRSWCVNCGGELLLAAVEVLMDELAKLNGDDASTVGSGLEMTIEQCFYCLYGHPNKRTKTKHLQDHTAKKVELTWERAYQLFEYFKPKTVPEFDSYKTSTVSNELENLLRRISALVPDHYNPASTVDSLTAYIDGLTDKPPTMPKDKEITTSVVKELYYLLADYYFKNKEQTKAIKFYQLDLCVNPDRMDSWAGMALARASRLQQKLNSVSSDT